MVHSIASRFAMREIVIELSSSSSEEEEEGGGVARAYEKTTEDVHVAVGGARAMEEEVVHEAGPTEEEDLRVHEDVLEATVGCAQDDEVGMEREGTNKRTREEYETQAFPRIATDEAGPSGTRKAPVPPSEILQKVDQETPTPWEREWDTNEIHAEQHRMKEKELASSSLVPPAESAPETNGGNASGANPKSKEGSSQSEQERIDTHSGQFDAKQEIAQGAQMWEALMQWEDTTPEERRLLQYLIDQRNLIPDDKADMVKMIECVFAENCSFRMLFLAMIASYPVRLECHSERLNAGVRQTFQNEWVMNTTELISRIEGQPDEVAIKILSESAQDKVQEKKTFLASQKQEERTIARVVREQDKELENRRIMAQFGSRMVADPNNPMRDVRRTRRGASNASSSSGEESSDSETEEKQPESDGTDTMQRARPSRGHEICVDESDTNEKRSLQQSIAMKRAPGSNVPAGDSTGRRTAPRPRSVHRAGHVVLENLLDEEEKGGSEATLDLDAPHECLMDDLSAGREPRIGSIPVLGPPDLKKRFDSIGNLRYINSSLVKNYKAIIPRLAFQVFTKFCTGGSCMSACDSGCGCAPEHGECAYTKDGKVTPKGLTFQVIRECNPMCECNPTLCQNRVVGRTFNQTLGSCAFPVSVRFVSSEVGWGVFAECAIPRGVAVMEYVGELLTEREAAEADNVRTRYLFSLKHSQVVGSLTLDASKRGNVASFVNHCCKTKEEENLENTATFSNGKTGALLVARMALAGDQHQDERAPRVVFFSRRDIEKGEELTLNYGHEIANCQCKVCKSK